MTNSTIQGKLKKTTIQELLKLHIEISKALFQVLLILSVAVITNFFADDLFEGAKLQALLCLGIPIIILGTILLVYRHFSIKIKLIKRLNQLEEQ